MPTPKIVTVCTAKRNAFPDYAVIVLEDERKYIWARSSARYPDLDHYFIDAKAAFEGKDRRYFRPFNGTIDLTIRHYY